MPAGRATGTWSSCCGCSEYTNLEALPAVAANLQDLAGVLTDPETGGFVAFACTLLSEPAEGFVPGAGRTLLDLAQELSQNATGDAAAVRVISAGSVAPLRQLAVNADLDADTVLARVRELPAGGGLDTATHRYVDLVEAGIVDLAAALGVGIETATATVEQFVLTP